MKIKRFLTIFITAVIFMQSVVLAYGGETDKDFENASGLLIALGIFDEDTRISDQAVTRGELAERVFRLYGVNDAVFVPHFKDVTADTENSQYISFLTDMGAISEGEYFYPEKTATYEQAVKMIVHILGYGKILEKDEWPSAVMNKAMKIGLLDNIEAGVGDVLTERMLMSLIYNSLGCSKLVRSDNTDYEVSEEKTLLSENFAVVKKHGIVTGTSKTYLSITGSTGEGYALIGDEEVRDEKALLQQLLGYDVYAYCRETDEKGLYEVIYVQKTDRNSVLKVKASELKEDEITDFSGIVYYEGARKKIKKLSKMVDLVSNGKSKPSFTVEDLKPSNGYLELIDNNNDGAADVVFVWEPDTYVLSVHDKENSLIVDKYGRYFDYSDFKDMEVYSMYGDRISLATATEWNVLSVYESADGEWAKVVVYDDPVIGTVSGMYENDGKTYIVVDEEHYAISEEYMKTVGAGNSNAVEIVLNQEGIYYLNADEEIAAVVAEKDYSSRYGYLVNALEDEENECLWLKLFYDEAVGVATLRAVDNLKIDGKKYTWKSAWVALCDGGNSVKQQLIRFTLDADGNVVVIDTENSGAGETKENLTCNAFKEKMYWSVRTGRLGSGESVSFLLDSKVDVFNVPITDVYDYSKYSKTVRKINNSSHTVSVYDSSSMGIAKAIVVYSDESDNTSIDLEKCSGGFLVDKITNTVNAEGEVVTMLSGYHLAGKAAELVVSEDVDTSFLKRGDIIDYKKNHKDEIKHINVLFDKLNSDFSASYTIHNNYGDSISTYSGNCSFSVAATVIGQKEGNYIKVPISRTDLEAFAPQEMSFAQSKVYSLGDSKIYLCEYNKIREITSGELESYIYDIRSEARAVTMSTYSQLRSLIVYAN